MVQALDLHSHTTASDGALSPTELVTRAYEKGLKALAITDHDTIDGLAEAITTANNLSITVIKGVEFSCVWNNITIHILGYNFAEDHPQLQALLRLLKEARWLRAEQIAEKLQSKGMDDLLTQASLCQQQNSTNAPGRPHFAQAMLKAGYVKNYKEAFQKWLGSGKIGDVKQHWPELTTIVQTLRESGAWISLAHPCHYNMTRSKLCKLLTDFIAAGGQAIEVVNGFQPAEQVGKLANLAHHFGLLSSAGSDFHQPNTWSELGLYRNMPDDLTPLWTKFPEVAMLLNEPC